MASAIVAAPALRAFDESLDSEPCLKCGWDRGEQKYCRLRMVAYHYAGLLEWSCPRCGHVIESRTKDDTNG